MPEFRHGLVVGKFYPPHAGHAHLVRVALSRCAEVTVQLLGSTVESIPLATRERWLREEHPTARVVAAIDDAPVDFASTAAWDAHTAVITALLESPVDGVFAGEAYGAELARRLGAAFVHVDRAGLAVSGTAVRADLAGTWWALAPAVRASLVTRVVVLGAESTGTTTLAAALAAAYGTDWVPEYGRAYSEERGLADPWRTDEFALIADRQSALEREAARRVPAPLLVCDTDALATAVWHERYAGGERSFPHEPPALYVLTGDEIPFVQDGWRDGEHVRHAMQQRFRDVLAAQPVPWLEVRGSVAERVTAARPAVDRALAAAARFAPPLEQAPFAPH